MPLTILERQVLAALRRDPHPRVAELAAALDVADPQIEAAIATLRARGHVIGRGWLLGDVRPIVVVGGAVMDLKLSTPGPTLLATSNPGHASWTPGGVGRNIAENLARLGNPVELVATIGADPPGVELVDRTRAAGVGVGHLIRSAAPTGTYCAVVDGAGELIVGVSDMEATDVMSVRLLGPLQDLFRRAEVLVLEGNLPAQVIGWLLDFAAAAGTAVVIDPVSVAKAIHLSTTLTSDRPVQVMTPNIDELSAILDRPIADDVDALAEAAAGLHARGVETAWIRRGPHGSLLSTTETGRQVIVTFDAPTAQVVDVTGAGDSMTAGFVHAWLLHGDVVEAARFGQALASLTVESMDTVRTDLSAALVEDRLARCAPTETTHGARAQGAR